MLHRIAQNTACHLVGDVVFESVGRSLHDDMACIVGHREVPPIVCRTLYARVDEVECLLCEVRTNNGTGPEYVDGRVETVAINGKLTVFSGLRPKLRVVGRADNER